MKIEVDGIVYEYDDETGELLSAEKQGFAVSDQASAEWLLEKIQEADCNIAALKAREEAILANIAAERKRIESQRNGLLFKYEGELVEFAKANLAPGKKSWLCPYGKVSFRTTTPRLKVADSEKALAWAKEFFPDAVKVTEEFQISKLDAEWKENLEKAPPQDREQRGFDMVPATETHKVETGVN